MSTNFLFLVFNVVSLGTLMILIQMLHKGTSVQVRFLVAFALVAAVSYYFFAERNAFYVRVAAARSSHSLSGTGPIELAAVWDNSNDGFFRGTELAIEEINAQGGVKQSVGGGGAHPIKLVKYADRDDIHYEVARSESSVAVIGHRSADHAISASLTYDINQMLYLASTVTNPSLTTHGFKNVFRTIPSDREFSSALVRYCASRGLRRIAVLYPRTRHGNSFSALFRDALKYNNQVTRTPDKALSIELMKSYAPDEKDFPGLVSELFAHTYDAILIADMLPRAGVLIKHIRTRGIEQVIIGSEALADARLWQDSGQQARNVVVASVMPADAGVETSVAAAEFQRRYLARYGMAADHWAGQGYESVRILAQAWQRAGTTLPRMVGSILRERQDWQGLYGNYGFSPNGDVLNHGIYLKTMHEGQFRQIAPVSVH